MTPDEIAAKFADFERRLAAAETKAARVDDLQARIDELQLMLNNRDGFNNQLAFNVNRLLHDMKQRQERDQAQS